MVLELNDRLYMFFDYKVQTKVEITVQYYEKHTDRELCDKEYYLLKTHLESQLVWKNA